MKIKRLTLEEAEKEIYKLVIGGRAFNKKRDVAFDEINRKYPVHYGDWDSKSNIEREKAFKEYEKKFDLELNKDWKRLNDLTETTPIAEDKQCCLNCVAPGLCTKRRYVSHNYYICSKYHPDNPFLFNFDVAQSLIDTCNEKSVRQEVDEYLDKYKKLLAHADECEKAVKQKIESLSEIRKYPTTPGGYAELLARIAGYKSAGYDVKVGVESTGNTRFFKNQVEKAGAEVTVITTLKFKVINESTKKTDKHDASIISEFLEKDMLPESYVCNQETENLRRLLKSRERLVRSIVGQKNEVHALLVSMGLSDELRSLQSKKVVD